MAMILSKLLHIKIKSQTKTGRILFCAILDNGNVRSEFFGSKMTTHNFFFPDSLNSYMT